MICLGHGWEWHYKTYSLYSWMTAGCVPLSRTAEQMDAFHLGWMPPESVAA